MAEFRQHKSEKLKHFITASQGSLVLEQLTGDQIDTGSLLSLDVHFLSKRMKEHI